MLNKKNSQKGFAALFVTILILVIIFGIGISLATLTLSEYKILKNIAKSLQSYYTAEAGVEDALLRIAKSLEYTSPYTLPLDQSSATIEISSIVGGRKEIISEGNNDNLIRKVKVIYSIETTTVSFHYGAQVGDGGMTLRPNATVDGNVFSNATVIAPEGQGIITNSIIVAGNGNKIQGLEVGDDAKAHTCANSTIGGNLTYVSGGSVVNCTAGGVINNQPNEILPESLPISQSQIDSWKTEANAGGILTEDYNLGVGKSDSLGPVQVGTESAPKNMFISNNAILNLTGTIYVTGDVTIDNGAIIRLDPSYGTTGGVIIVDGKINVINNTVFEGSGQPGSYVLVISTNSSLDPLEPAINLNNNVEGAVFYTSSGLIHIHNNVAVKEVTGYKILLDNNATITYETGLSDASFSSGPGGSWEIVNWREVQ